MQKRGGNPDCLEIKTVCGLPLDRPAPWKQANMIPIGIDRNRSTPPLKSINQFSNKAHQVGAQEPFGYLVGQQICCVSIDDKQSVYRVAVFFSATIVYAAVPL